MSREDVNRFELEGNLVRDPEPQPDYELVNLTIATSRWGFAKGDYNTKKRYTSFVRVTAGGRDYEDILLAGYKQGQRVRVTGRIESYSREKQDGTFKNVLNHKLESIHKVEG